MSLRMERVKKRKKRIWAIQLSLLLLALVLLAAFAYDLEQKAFRNLKEKRMQIVTVSQGNLVDSLAGRALVINQEYLVQAPKQGRFENQAQENAKVRKGQTLGLLIDKDQKIPLTAPGTGIYTAQIDGLEQVLKDPVLNAVGPEIFAFRARIVNADPAIKAGRPVCKVIDNLIPNILVVRIDGEASYLPDIKPGSRVNLWLKGQMLGSALVKEIRLDKPALLKLETDNFSEALIGQRYYDLTLTQDSGSGLLVPVSALLGDEANRSVYSYKDGKIYAKKVQVVKIKDKQALVTGLELNEMVVGDPSVVDSEDIIS
ncbi:MAG: HlyD family efflux transporter periplasmic adaptor subunit [Syntrophomonas sp.]